MVRHSAASKQSSILQTTHREMGVELVLDSLAASDRRFGYILEQKPPDALVALSLARVDLTDILGNLVEVLRERVEETGKLPEWADDRKRVGRRRRERQKLDCISFGQRYSLSRNERI
jgi:hypothetical protein